MVGLSKAGLSYRDIAAHTGHAVMTVVRIWNQWREEGHTLRRAGTGPHCDHSTGWPPYYPQGRVGLYSFIHSVESTLEYCNGFGHVCFNSSSPSFEDWTSGSHAIASASIVQRPQTPKTAVVMWTPSLECWVVTCSVSGRVPLQHVLQRWPHICSTLCWWTQSVNLLQRYRRSTHSVMVWGTIGYNIWSRSYVLRAIWTATTTLGRFYNPWYCLSLRQLHMSYFSRTMPGNTWQGLCKPFSKDNRKARNKQKWKEYRAALT